MIPLPQSDQINPSILARIQAAAAFSHTQAQITSCKSCPLSAPPFNRQPVPMVGSAASSLSIITAAPTPFDDQSGQPLSAAHVRNYLANALPKFAGITLARTTFIHALCCRPNNPADQLQYQPKCTTNLIRQITASNTSTVLICGPDALRSFTTIPFQKAVSKGWLGPDNRAYLVTVDPYLALSCDQSKTVFESDLAFLLELLQYEFVIEAARIFTQTNSWTSLIDSKIADLTADLKRQHKIRFLVRTIGETKSSPIAVAQAELCAKQEQLW